MFILLFVFLCVVAVSECEVWRSCLEPWPWSFPVAGGLDCNQFLLRYNFDNRLQQDWEIFLSIIQRLSISHINGGGVSPSNKHSFSQGKRESGWPFVSSVWWQHYTGRRVSQESRLPKKVIKGRRKNASSLCPSYRRSRVYKWNQTMFVRPSVRHHFEDDYFLCS